MKAKPRKRFPVPPVFKMLFRGYMIMGFILVLHHFGVMASTGLVVFLVTVVSISMVFGVGYLLIMQSRPVRAGSISIPDTVLFFVKGAMILYFVSLLAEFRFVPVHVTSLLILIISTVMAIAAAASYLYEVVERARPAPASAPKPVRTRRVPSSRSSAVRGRSS